MLAAAHEPAATDATSTVTGLPELTDLDRELDVLLSQDVSPLVVADATTTTPATAEPQHRAASTAVELLESRIHALEARVQALEGALAGLAQTVETFEERCEATLTEAATAAAESVLRLVGDAEEAPP